MQHIFEFVAKTEDGRTIHMNYKGKSSRKTKVTRHILEDLEKAYGINAGSITELYLKPVKN